LRSRNNRGAKATIIRPFQAHPRNLRARPFDGPQPLGDRSGLSPPHRGRI
jgi:hypothetical protein